MNNTDYQKIALGAARRERAGKIGLYVFLTL